jgi:hypothetical protein
LGNGIKNIFGNNSNIAGTSAATDPYTGQPSGSLSQNTTANNESNAYFDLPAGVSPNGSGGYVDTSGNAVNANGTPIYTGMGSPGYNPDASASTGSWVDAGDGSLVWQPN